MPAPALLGARGTGHPDVAEDVGQGDASTTELQLLGRRVHTSDALLELPAGADVTVELTHKLSIRLWDALGNGELSVVWAAPKTPVCATQKGRTTDHGRGQPFVEYALNFLHDGMVSQFPCVVGRVGNCSLPAVQQDSRTQELIDRVGKYTKWNEAGSIEGLPKGITEAFTDEAVRIF